MNSERWQRVKAIFADALERDAGDRARYLDDVCHDDTALRREVRALLDEAIDDDFLDPPRPTAIRAASDEPATAVTRGTRLGPYELTEPIARGGMGSVWRARRADDAFEKTVALKVIRRGLATGALREAFDRERQTLARLEHPNIVRLLDGGVTTEGVSWLVMEYIDGRSIDAHCEAMHCDRATRVDLMLRVCDAVAHAHRNLIVHRDLKPGNILVDGDGRVKLLDFGIACLVEESAVGVEALTPAYSSPEQQRGDAVTTAADVYALGVILHEVMTGHRPGTDAPLRGELGAIVRQATAEAAVDRYPSVEAMADDLRRLREKRPVRARRASPLYALRCAVRRHPTQMATLAVAVLAVVGALVAVSLALVNARQAEDDALEDRARALTARGEAREVLRFYEGMLASANPFRNGEPVNVIDLLREAESRMMRDLVDRPGVEAGVRLAAGRTYGGLMMWDEAAQHLHLSLDIQRRSDEPDDAMLAETLSWYSRALSHQQRSAAVDMGREAVAIRTRLFGPDHPLVAESTGNLGYALWASRPAAPQWEEAEAHYRKALDLFDAADAGVTRDAARVTLSLGYMLTKLGRLEEAETYYRSAIEIHETLGTSEDLYDITARRLYADLLGRTGRGSEAIAMVEACLAELPDDFRPDYRRLMLTSLAMLHAGTGACDTATTAYRRVLALDCDLATSRADAPVDALRELARRLRSDEPLDIGLAVDEVVALSCTSPLCVTTYLEELPSLHMCRGDLDTALDLLRECYAIQIKHMPEMWPAPSRVRQRIRALGGSTP